MNANMQGVPRVSTRARLIEADYFQRKSYVLLNIHFSGEWWAIEVRCGPAFADKFFQKAAWAPFFSTRDAFITIRYSREILPVAVSGI